MLEDGPQDEWGDALRKQSQNTTSEHVRTFNLLKMPACKIITELDQPNVLVVLHATALQPPLGTCRDQVRTYLHEADKILRHTAKLGGSSVLVTSPTSPLRWTAKLAKLTVDYHWEDVYRTYDPANPLDSGRLMIQTNNTAVRYNMYGFRDPTTIPAPDAALAASDAEYLSDLAGMLMRGARQNHAAAKRVLTELLQENPKDDTRLRKMVTEDVVQAMRVPRRRHAAKTAASVPALYTVVERDDRVSGSPAAPAFLSTKAKAKSEHQERNPDVSKVVLPMFAVARKVPRSEWGNAECADALNVEMKKQLEAPWPKGGMPDSVRAAQRNPTGKGCSTWITDQVCEESEVLAWARKAGITIQAVSYFTKRVLNSLWDTMTAKCARASTASG